MLNNMTIRFYCIDYDLEDGPDIVEVSESQFLTLNGRISYHRNTIRENGSSSVSLVKDNDA